MPKHARIVIGRDGRIALVNERAELLLGARADELQGLRTEDMVPERHRAHHVEVRDLYFAEPWSSKGSYGSFITVLDRKGRERKVFVLPDPIATEDGLWVSIVLSLPEADRDVDESPLPTSASAPATAFALEPKAV